MNDNPAILPAILPKLIVISKFIIKKGRDAKLG